MTEIGEPFGFFNPARHGKPPFSKFSSKRTRASLRRTITSFPIFLQLPFELRTEIIMHSMEDITETWCEWLKTRHGPVVLQSRRGVLRVQPQRKKPPSPAQLACVSKEWQDQIEPVLFNRLGLIVLPDSGPDDCSDLVKFAATVTGPRRRYLSKLQIKLLREHSDSRHTGIVMRLLQILGTWSREQVADHFLQVELRIKLQDSPSHPLMEEIKKLPTISVIGDLDFAVDLRGEFRKLPLALHCLIRKLPGLENVDFYLSPWCSLDETERNYKIEALMDGLHSAAPQLKELVFTIPSIDEQPFWHRELGSLTGLPVLSILEISYSLESLILSSSIDLSLFFKYFHSEAEDIGLICSSWPELEALSLQGSIVDENNLMTQLEKDWFLEVVGRAARRMPKLQIAMIETWSRPSLTLDANWMVIIFETNSVQGMSTDSEGFRLAVGGHTPSSSAVSVWKDAIQRTKGLNPVVEFDPETYLDESGEPQPGDWQVWKEN